MTLQDAIYTLDQIGFTDVFLPFILIYTVLFAILTKVNLFGAKSGKKFNSIIALAVSLLVVIPHTLGKYPAGTDVIEILNTFLPNVSLLILVVLFIMMISSFFGLSWGKDGNGGAFTNIASLLSVVALLAIFAVSAGWWTPYGPFNFLIDSDIQATILIIGVFWLIISMTMGDEDKTAETKNKGQGGNPNG